MRVFFSQGKQKKFINIILSKLSVKESAKLCNFSERTIRDWRRGKFSVDLKALRKLCKKTGISFPSNIKLKDDYWYTAYGSSAGGLAVYKKYGRIGGDPEYRKKKWYEWWNREGRYKQHPITKICLPIKKPRKSENLAEFVGIVMGDGSITKKQIIVTLHYKDDEKYSKFVVNLIKKLFNVHVGRYSYIKSSAIKIIISRRELIRFCVERLGLKQGNKVKQQIDMPDWIKRNKQYAIACVRGLVDTDGCVFTHRYKVNRKWYSYKKFCFTSFSKPLRQSVFDILKDNGLRARLAGKRDVRIDSKEDMNTYFRLFGFHNPKHLKRYKN